MAAAKKKAKKKKEVLSNVFRGKRKESIARATISKGKGIVRLNSQLLSSLENRYAREMIAEPLRVVPEVASQVNISLNVVGGGAIGQAQACSVAVARALIGFSGDESVRRKILEHDRFMVTEDSRRVAPKKYKGPKARARSQKSYR